MNLLLSLPPSPSNIYTGKDFLTSHAVDQVEISSLLIVIVKLFLALGICVFSKSSYIVLHPCTDYVLISCSRLPAASNI